MKNLKWCLILGLVVNYAVANDTQFKGVQILEESDGYKLILKFWPKVPGYSTIYSKKQNGTEIRWNASAEENLYKIYNFKNADVMFTKVAVWVDKKKGKGILQMMHRQSDSYSLVQRNGNELVLLLRPEKERQFASADVPKAQPRPPQKLINLNVKDAPLNKLLRTLAAESQKSVVFGSEVDGSVTVNVKDMTYEQAVDTVLKPTKFRAEHTSNATVVRSAKEGKSFRVFHLSNVDVNPILKQVQDMAKDGTVTADPHTNTLFVTDSVENLVAIERMLATIDVPIKQVEVETAILELEDQTSTDIGFNFDSVIHAGRTATDKIASEISTKRISPFDPGAAAPKGMFVGLTWQSVHGILGLLNQNSKLTVLARPRVVALNDQEANILIGSKIGYKTTTVSTTGTVEDVKFLTVGTQLRIKPHITSLNDILMQIKPEVSDGSLDPVTRVPSEKTTSSETKVLAKDGQTVVIGGLLRDRTEKVESKVPILGDIPLLGFFFKGTTESVQKNEIVILLSPKLIDQNAIASFERERVEMLQKHHARRINSLPEPQRAGGR